LFERLVGVDVNLGCFRELMPFSGVGVVFMAFDLRFCVVAEQALVEDAFADLAREHAATDAVLAECPDLGARVGQRGIAVRELWVHRIEEYARHCGHADLLRECVDGRVGQ
jgi:hypothetical protein